MVEASPLVNPPYAADSFVSPIDCLLKLGPAGTEVELPVKLVTYKRTAALASVKNHRTRGHPLHVVGGYTGTIEFNMPVAVGVYTISIGSTYSMIFVYSGTTEYTQQVRITDITDTIPDPDGTDPPMYAISGVIEGQIAALGTL